ncbi:type I-E CRISPR-associated protein Cse1/CasA [Streptomyces albidoflavus]
MPQARPPGPAAPRFSWDPRYRPCIPAMSVDGATTHHSLCALFEEAEQLSTIHCATPGETVAVIEFLMAICFASSTCPASPEEWRSWIEEEHDLRSASMWLRDQRADAWDLFHPETPLGQNGWEGFARYLDERGSGPAQLVIERAGDYSQHFDHRHLDHVEPLPAAEAFRAVITQHVYAPYGRARMSGEGIGPKITNLAAGRLTGRVRVVALGRTLGETLRLNLYPPDGPGQPLNTSWTSGSTVRRGFKEKAKPRVPSNSADLHSALGRSIVLRPAEGPYGQIVVDRVLIGAGEVLDLDPARHLQDAVFSERNPDKPLWPSPTRALWRDAHALYSAVRDARAGLYERLHSLKRRQKAAGIPYQLWAVGLITNKSLAVAWTQGSYPYAPAMERHLYRASHRGSEVAEYVAESLRRAAVVAAENIYPAAFASDQGADLSSFDARWKFWPAAEQPFNQLLEQVAKAGLVDDDDPVSEPLVAYAETLVTSARFQLARRLDTLPPNNKGYRARARAEQRFEDDMESPKAPAEIRGESAHD